MATLDKAKELANKIISGASNNIDRILVFGSIALRESGNDIDIIVIVKNNTGKTQKHFYNDIQQLVVTPFIKQEFIGVDLFVWDINNVIELNKKGSPFLKLIQREGRVLYMSEDHLKEWFKFARDDYEMACILLANDYYRGSCIHSQQAIEKCLKGLLIKNKWELEKTHNIGSLVSFSAKYNIPLEIKDEEIELIDSIYRGRYPAEEGLLPFGEPDKEIAIKVLKTAVNVLNQSGAYTDLKEPDKLIKKAKI